MVQSASKTNYNYTAILALDKCQESAFLKRLYALKTMIKYFLSVLAQIYDASYSITSTKVPLFCRENGSISLNAMMEYLYNIWYLMLVPKWRKESLKRERGNMWINN